MATIWVQLAIFPSRITCSPSPYETITSKQVFHQYNRLRPVATSALTPSRSIMAETFEIVFVYMGLWNITAVASVVCYKVYLF